MDQVKHELSVNQEREALRLRCIAGNDKLQEAWYKLKEMNLPDEVWATAMDKWHLANEKLSVLCTQLEILGYDICLYIEKGVKTRQCLRGDHAVLGCRVCPSKIYYWENELMLLPSGGDKAPAKESKPVEKESKSTEQPVLIKEETQAEKDLKTLWPPENK